MSIEKVEQVIDTPTPAPASCPACGAPEYNEPLDRLFVRGDGAKRKGYECGAVLVFHDVPPVRTEVTSPCSRSFAASVALRAQLAQAQAERVNFNLVYAKKEDVTFYCVYCNKDFVMPDPESVREHTVTCDKHPMRQLESERDAARADSERYLETNNIRQSALFKCHSEIDALTAQLAEARAGITNASHSRYLAERVAELELEAATLRTRLERVTGAGQRVINTARPEPDLPEWEDEFYVPAKSIRALVDALHAEYEILVNCVCGHTSMAHDEQGWCYHQAEGCKCKQFQRAALTGSESGDAK